MTKSNKEKDKKMRDQGGFEPDILRGAITNNLSVVRAALAKNKENITKADGSDGLTALHHAAARGNVSMTEFLLGQEGVDVSKRDRWDRDPLDVAIQAGHPGCIDALFKFRAGPEPDDGPDTSAGHTGNVVPIDFDR